MTLSNSPELEVQMLIKKPASVVFQAFIEPCSYNQFLVY